MPRPLALAALALALTPTLLPADDWPQWMGPDRDGVWKETGVLERFPAGGPKKLWSAPVGGGYSGPAVAAGKVYVFDYLRGDGDASNNPAKRSEVGGKERLLCLDAKTGAELWKYDYDCPYKISYPAGPRCTPTVSGGKVYALGAMGNLAALDAATGKVAWAKDLKAEYGVSAPLWGFAGHPLVYRNLLICLVGGDGTTAVGFDKETGKEVWRALSAPEPGYSPPTLIETGGVPQVIVWHAKAVNALNPLTGERLWSVPLEPNYGMAIMAPRRSGDHLFAAGIMGKAAMLKLSCNPPAAAEEWHGAKGKAVYPVNMTPAFEDGVIYGVDQPGQLRAVRAATGERLWATFRPVTGDEKDEDFSGAKSGTAFLVKNAGRYFVFAETGHLVIAKLSPERYEEIDRAKLVEPTGEAFGRKVVWTHPAFADKCVFVRNDKEIACFSLAAE